VNQKLVARSTDCQGLRSCGRVQAIAAVQLAVVLIRASAAPTCSKFKFGSQDWSDSSSSPIPHNFDDLTTSSCLRSRNGRMRPQQHSYAHTHQNTHILRGNDMIYFVWQFNECNNGAIEANKVNLSTVERLRSPPVGWQQGQRSQPAAPACASMQRRGGSPEPWPRAQWPLRSQQAWASPTLHGCAGCSRGERVVHSGWCAGVRL
jgi:hypothetical protein